MLPKIGLQQHGILRAPIAVSGRPGVEITGSEQQGFAGTLRIGKDSTILFRQFGWNFLRRQGVRQ